MQKGEQYILMTGREWQFGWYAQDRWQVTRKLTVNIGLRYEYYPADDARRWQGTRAAGSRYEPGVPGRPRQRARG